MKTDSTGKDRSAATGVACKRANQFLHFLPVDVADRTPGEMRQKLVAQIAAVDDDRPGLPDPLAALEDCLGDGFEEGLAGCVGCLFAAPDGGQYFSS